MNFYTLKKWFMVSMFPLCSALTLFIWPIYMSWQMLNNINIIKLEKQTFAKIAAYIGFIPGINIVSFVMSFFIEPKKIEPNNEKIEKVEQIKKPKEEEVLRLENKQFLLENKQFLLERKQFLLKNQKKHANEKDEKINRR